MKHDEERLQIECVRWFGLQYPEFAPLLHHSPNGGKRNLREAARFKAMGTRAGFPDLALFVPRGGRYGLFIEMKSEDGRQTAEQKNWQAELELYSYRYEVSKFSTNSYTSYAIISAATHSSAAKQCNVNRLNNISNGKKYTL